MSNRLKGEKSPYLLQHADNPVEWYPWCEEAFLRAKSEDKPIFLSIGYSTCHWCHVMARESFENIDTATILNKHFISIKVDREERPDIDSVYMTVCQAFTGNGGWPMSIFMTWDKKPFFAGTYFPPHARYGVAGFTDLLNTIAINWKENRENLLKSAEEIVAHIKNSKKIKPNTSDGDITQKSFETFNQIFDVKNGGFGAAPKFPSAHNLLFLMLYAKQNNNQSALCMVEKTLMAMRKGGIFDHIGYGFSRYSTDKYYLVPHFEKMLYDNALLIMAYAAAYSMTGNKIYLDTAEKTAKYIQNEMTSPCGGFYSAQDADSEGIEGRFYTFSLGEIFDVLGEDSGRKFSKTFDITENGNFEGKNIPNLLKSNDLKTDFQEETKKLYDYRKNRTKLHLDDKILLSWNSLMIAALSILYRVTKNEQYINMAKNALDFIENNLSGGDELFSVQSGKNSFLDDYAFYIAALIELYSSTLNHKYLDTAENFCKKAITLFEDSENGGFFLCQKDKCELFINPKDSYDGAIPSGNSVMAYNLVRLRGITQKDLYDDLAKRQISYMEKEAQDYPISYSMFLIALSLFENPPKHITAVLKDNKDLGYIKDNAPLLADIALTTENKNYPLINNKTTYYVCENKNCLPPSNEL